MNAIDGDIKTLHQAHSLPAIENGTQYVIESYFTLPNFIALSALP